MKTPRLAALVLWVSVALSVSTGWPRTEFLWMGFAFNVAAFGLCFLYGRRMRPDRPYRGGVRWFIAWIGVSLVGVWVADHRTPPHQEARLGGWFTGHGDLVAAISGAVTYDYSLMFRPESIHAVAISPDGQLAATVADYELRIWDIASQTSLCEAYVFGYHGNASTDLYWVGDTVFFVDAPRNRAAPDSTRLVRYPISAIESGVCGELPEDKVPAVLTECATERAFFLAQYEETGVVVRPIQRDPTEVVSQTNGYALEAPPILKVDGLGLNQPTWLFSPGCKWLFWWTWERVGGGPEVRGSTLKGHRVAVQPGSTPTSFSTFVPHKPYEPPPNLGVSADGRSIGAVSRGVVTTYNLSTREAKSREGIIANEASFVFPKVRVAPDGAMVVISGRPSYINADPGVIAVLEPGSLETRYELSGHGDSILDLAFSNDGRRLITGSRDQTARVWTLPTKDSKSEEGNK